MAPLSASNWRQEERAPGRCGARRLSAASGALRPLGSSRYSLARASAAPRGPSLEPGPRSGHSRGQLSCQICYTCFLPLTPERTALPSRQGKSGSLKAIPGSFAPESTAPDAHLPVRSNPLPCQPPLRAIPPPGPAWVQYHSLHGADSGRAATPPPPPPRPVAIYWEASPKAAAEAAEQGQPRETFSELTQLRR